MVSGGVGVVLLVAVGGWWLVGVGVAVLSLRGRLLWLRRGVLLSGVAEVAHPCFPDPRSEQHRKFFGDQL